MKTEHPQVHFLNLCENSLFININLDNVTDCDMKHVHLYIKFIYKPKRTDETS